MPAAVAHVNTDPNTQPAGAAPAWLKVSAAMAVLANTFAERTDLVVITGPDAAVASGAPACFSPAGACIEINSDACLPGIDPATMDPGNPRDLHRYPAGIGALAHEAAHAAHSLWRPDATWPAPVAEAATLLEEIRIEAAHLQRRPGDRDWLRACVSAIVAPNLTITDPKTLDAWDAAVPAALLLGRVDAGVLDPTETTTARAKLSRALTKPVLARLRRIWLAVIKTGDSDKDRMKRLAERWCRILDADPRSGPGRTPRKAADRRRAIDAARQTAASISATAKNDITQHAQTGTPTPNRGAGQGGPSTGSGQGKGPGSGSAADRVFGRHHQIATRTATSAEQSAARRLARALTHAPVTQTEATTTDSVIPPGRLRFGQVLAAHAQSAAGGPVNATPWRKTIRKRPPQPRPKVGIALDVSISMSDIIGPAASAAWICAHAATHAHGQAVAATFGEQAKSLIPPGPPPAQVPQPALEGDTNHLDVAIGALDTALNLSRPGVDARILILVTDGELAPRQHRRVAGLLADLAASGCALLQITPDTKGVHLPHTTLAACPNPAQAIPEITKAVTAALTTATRGTK